MSVTSSWAGGGSAWSVLVHGGAGDIPPHREAVHAAGCARAVEAAIAILRDGGRALDAAERAVRVLEDDPCFNAGTGACLTTEHTLELDAAIMDGASLAAGAVCALPAFENPIAIARAVLEEGEHVLYAADGARRFAEHAGFSPADPERMITQAARDKLAAAIASGKAHSWAGGTVGAVVRDAQGHVAAATSAGGTSGKRPGRIGDSPVLGAGTYADDRGGAASATGHGEGILRVALCAEAIAALRTGATPEAAARSVIENLAERVGSTGGIILADQRGRLGFARSTRTMSWAAGWPESDVLSGT